MSHQQVQPCPERMISGEVAVRDAAGLADRSGEVRHEVTTNGAAAEVGSVVASTPDDLMHLAYAVASYERRCAHLMQHAGRMGKR